MMIVQYVALGALILCFGVLFFHFLRLIKLGNPKDFSEKSGNIANGILYSSTVAMAPQNKESAYLHLPTYTMGIFYHIGTFFSFFIFILSFFPFFNHWLIQDQFIHYLIPVFLIVTCLCGFILFIKRMVKKSLKGFTNPDDYLSNAFTTLFQLATLLYLFLPQDGIMLTTYYIFTTLLFLYMPVGKLKHVVYFFAARYHLGFFYGWRNVWPAKEK